MCCSGRQVAEVGVVDGGVDRVVVVGDVNVGCFNGGDLVGGVVVGGVVEQIFPDLPCLDGSGLSIPGRAVGQVGVRAEEGVRRKGGEPVVGDGEVCAHGLALGVLHLHDIVRDAGVCRPYTTKA